jgi:NTE family protein
MSNSYKQYKNLVFEGGGVKGAAYAGVVDVLDQQGLLDPIERVAGTSAGSMTAALLAIGSGSTGLKESILNSDFNLFTKDSGWIIADLERLFKKFGVHSGKKFEEILKGFINQYTGNPELTFAELEQKVYEEPNRYKHLAVVAANLSTQNNDVFDSDRTPDIPIWKAVRCSMSIPFIFEPFVIQGNYYADGGLGWVYPIDIFDKKDEQGEAIINTETLGFYLLAESQIGHPGYMPVKTEINSLKDASAAIFNFLINNSNAKHIHKKDMSRTVFISDLGFSATDFNISRENIHRLIESGREATMNFLNL